MQSLEKRELTFEIEQLDQAAQYNEYMMISLRCLEGFDLKHIESSFGKAYSEHTQTVIQTLQAQDVLEQNSTSYCLKKSAKFLADGIAAEFFIVD
jgi:oxygen-independent coproporphyrinogen-3 oxidase